MGLKVEKDHHPSSVVGSQSTIIIAILYIYYTLCLLFAYYCQYLVIEFVVYLTYGPMYLLLQVSTQTSVARSSVVGRYGKGDRAGVGKGTGSGSEVGSLQDL